MNKISKTNKNNRNNIYPIEDKNDITINKKHNNNLNIMTLFYEIKKYPVQIFGNQFVENNKNNCYLLINDEVKELCTQLHKNEINLENNVLKIKLIEINTITNMSAMFSFEFEFNSLISLPDISKWNTANVTSFCCMFKDCLSLEFLPDISRWNTTNVEDMTYMFSGCKSLEYLPEISRWNTKNVEEMRNMFNNCSSLVSLPDKSEWNTTNVTNMEGMFNGCSSLVSLPDISKWNTTYVT